MKLRFFGDTHGAVGNVLHQDPSNVDMVFQCGDFGVWPIQDIETHRKCWEATVPVYFCRGNHEWHDFLDEHPRHEVSFLGKTSKDHGYTTVDVFFGDNGALHTFIDDEGYEHTVLFMGGGLSIDKHLRVEGMTWWPQEQMSNEEYMKIFELVKDKKIDIVVSHTCPQFIVDQRFEDLTQGYDNAKLEDNTQVQLAHLWYNLKHTPKLWVFGHWHSFTMSIMFDNTMFVGLADRGSDDTHRIDVYTHNGAYYIDTRYATEIKQIQYEPTAYLEQFKDSELSRVNDLYQTSTGQSLLDGS